MLKRLLKAIKDYFVIIAGSLITALSINLFLLPHKIAPGGVSGIATVVYYLSDGKLPVGLVMLALNVPLFIAGMRFIGSKFIVRTLFATIFLSLAVDTMTPITSFLQVKYLSTQDILLVSIYGGFLMGVGLGMVFRYGATTGGTDLAARIVRKFLPGFTMGQLLLFIDTSVIIFASIVFNDVQLGLYAIVTLFISSKVIDVILEGVDFAKAVFIITDKSDEISRRLLKDLDRGVTGLDGKGMYTGNYKQVLLCVVPRFQIPMLKEIVKEVDHNAFVIMAEIREVMGEGFQIGD